MFSEEKTIGRLSNRLMHELRNGFLAFILGLAIAPGSYADSIYVVNDSVRSMAMVKDSSNLYVSTVNDNTIRISEHHKGRDLPHPVLAHDAAVWRVLAARRA
ncbi:MAG TPA: hypothetical protein VF534_29135 [Paraburkholderia sp.]